MSVMRGEEENSLEIRNWRGVAKEPWPPADDGKTESSANPPGSAQLSRELPKNTKHRLSKVVSGYRALRQAYSPFGGVSHAERNRGT